MRIDNKGFSLVELLMAIVISLIVLGAIVLAYTGSLKVFKDVKSISDTIQTKTPSIELLGRYFDRWGVGVVSQQEKATCTQCPQYQRIMTITTTNGCSDITFYGNLYGFGFVQSISGATANLISCRLSRSSNQNCYVIWRDSIPQNDISSNNILPVGLSSNLSANNADCSALASGTTSNATVSSTLSDKTVQAGDIIQRTPHKIRLYCANNSNDGNRKWLYVDLTDQSAGYCADNESASPITPVESFTVSALGGCTPASGNCRAVQVSVTLRSQSQKYAGQFDTYTVTKVFGR